MRLLAACLLPLALCGCGLFGGKPEPRLTGVIYSPNGEPLSGGPLGDPKCEDALGGWFARVDRDHDGSIDLAEFMADASRQFAAMDLDKSGVLTPATLAKYRAPYLSDQPHREARGDDEDAGDSGGGRRRRDAGDEVPMSEDRADPVMLADVDLRNQVTRDQFMAYARRNFASLDQNQTGRIDRDELLATCKR